MENNNATIPSKHISEVQKEERWKNSVQNKLKQFGNWCNTKAFPAIREGVTNFFEAIFQIRINWTGILVLVILMYMANNGVMEEVPGIKWIVESAVRLIDWCFNIFKSFIGWFINFLDFQLLDAMDIFGLFNWISEFMKNIFAL